MTYTFQSATLGAPDISVVTTIAPGVANLPSNVLEPQLGEIRQGWDTTLGSASFIYLKCAASTAIPVGTICKFSANGYTAAVLDAGATSKNTGRPIAIAVNAIASSASVQYAWFLVQGVTAVLKTATTAAPDTALYVSATAGRLYATASTGKQILGARTVNTATITTTTSTVLCYLNFSSMEGL